MNTTNKITHGQASALWHMLDLYTENHGYPDFWSLENSEYLTITVQDFDGNHDFSFIGSMLESVGVTLDPADMLHPLDIARMERDGEQRPFKAATVEGDGEHGRLYGYELILTPPAVQMGQTCITRGARAEFTDEELRKCFFRHEAGDWGDTSPADAAANDAGLNPETQDRLVSLYKFPDDRRLFLITEYDRSVTTALLPSEY